MALFRKALGIVLFAAAVAACASHAPPLAADHTVVVRGRLTAGLSPTDATKTVLVDAARLTVDHGFQYFRIVRASYGGAIRPGEDVTVKIFLKDDVRAGAPGLWDAQAILLKGVSPNMLAAAGASR